MGRIAERLSGLQLETIQTPDEQLTLEHLRDTVNRLSSNVGESFSAMRDGLIAADRDLPGTSWEPVSIAEVRRGGGAVTQLDCEGPVNGELDGEYLLDLRIRLVAGTAKAVRIRVNNVAFTAAFQCNYINAGTSTKAADWTIVSTTATTRLWGYIRVNANPGAMGVTFEGAGGYGIPGSDVSQWRAAGHWNVNWGTNVQSLGLDTSVADKIGEDSRISLYRRSPLK